VNKHIFECYAKERYVDQNYKKKQNLSSVMSNITIRH